MHGISWNLRAFAFLVVPLLCGSVFVRQASLDVCVQVAALPSALERATAQIIHVGDKGSPKATERDGARFLGNLRFGRQADDGSYTEVIRLEEKLAARLHPEGVIYSRWHDIVGTDQKPF